MFDVLGIIARKQCSEGIACPTRIDSQKAAGLNHAQVQLSFHHHRKVVRRFVRGDSHRMQRTRNEAFGFLTLRIDCIRPMIT
jgi:hypothetical protein